MSWGWKLATSPDDVMNFLNGAGAYSAPVSAARVCAMWKGNHAEFYVFYQRHTAPAPAHGWGWKLATDPKDVRRFLCGMGAYGNPVKDAQIACFWKVNHPEFYVFYQNPGPDEHVDANWGWKLSPEPTDVANFLNGSGVYAHPPTTARIAALERTTHGEFYIFYQGTVQGDPVDAWTWKLATTPDDALNYVNGTGACEFPVAGFEMASLWNGSQPLFYVFANPGSRISVDSPLENERFVQGEPISLRAVLISEQVVDTSALRWTSDTGSVLGVGPQVVIGHLPVGTHTLSVAGCGAQATRTVRVFANLGEFYKAAPSTAELDRIKQDFEFMWTDGDGVAEQWDAYPEVFDQQSTDPSKMVIYARLDVLRHQGFAEPLPFTAGKSIYEHLKTYVRTLRLRLDCGSGKGGAADGGWVSLPRDAGYRHQRILYQGSGPDYCKDPPSSLELDPYTIYLLIHEERHCEPDDPGHVTVDGSQYDPYLEGGSGHAWAAMYLMWVYKYGKYDPLDIKEDARWKAGLLLESRFPTAPTHSNPKVQAIIDELVVSRTQG